MAQFLQENLHIVRFAYGLIFFILGFAIVLQPRRDSVYFLSTALSWLAAFALVHAFADWGLFFLPSHEQQVNPVLFKQLMGLRSLGVIVSFGFLMQFGLTLLLGHHPARHWFSLVPSVLTALAVLLLLTGEYAPPGTPWWITDTRVTMRYFLGAPSALLSAWGLLTQVSVLKRDHLGKYAGYLYGAAICFVLYAFVGGLITPERNFFPANILNERQFFLYTGIPVEVARSLAVLGVTYFTVRLLDIFHVESHRRLQAVEQDRALLRERERIARELHDGIMQTLYGTGLGLKQAIRVAGPQGQGQVMLEELNREIGRAIVRMRRFVLDLKEATITEAELAEAVCNLATEIGQIAGIRVTLQTEIAAPECGCVPAGIREEVLAIVREGLSNVVRHASASEVQLMFSLDDKTVLLRIADNGCGFEPGAQSLSRGLDALRDRVDALGGFLQVHSGQGRGTQLIAHLPVSRNQPYHRKEMAE